MLKKLALLLISTTLFFQGAIADIINIGIYHHRKITSFTFQTEEGSYSVFTEHGKLLELDSTELLTLQFSNNTIIVCFYILSRCFFTLIKKCIFLIHPPKHQQHQLIWTITLYSHKTPQPVGIIHSYTLLKTKNSNIFNTHPTPTL